MIDRAHIIFSLINVGTDDRSLFIFSFFFVPARLSFPFRRAIHLQMTSWGSIALLLKRKWKRKSFVTVGKTWLIIKWKEPSKAWPHQRILLFILYYQPMVCYRRYDFLFIGSRISVFMLAIIGPQARANRRRSYILEPIKKKKTKVNVRTQEEKKRESPHTFVFISFLCWLTRI